MTYRVQQCMVQPFFIYFDIKNFIHIKNIKKAFGYCQRILTTLYVIFTFFFVRYNFDFKLNIVIKPGET